MIGTVGWLLVALVVYLLIALYFIAVLARSSISAHGGRDEEIEDERRLRTDGVGDRIDVLYPECEECGRRDGIHKAVIGPADPSGMHDVERYELACGHALHPEARIEEGVVTLIESSRPDVIEYADGVNGGRPQ